jgi:2-keto-4-pentenoate hydratase/2-oxohepta-3-ene-1,7-dioic acid hydratase in catechol pathway
MRICRFDNDRLGLVVDAAATIVDVSAALEFMPPLHWPLSPGDPLVANLAILRPQLEALASTGARKRLADVQLKSPVATPSKIMAAPVNYMRHLEEAQADQAINFGSEIKTIDHYGLFLKASNSLVGPSEGVELPRLDRRMDHEVELAVVIGRAGYRIPKDRAMDYVAGYSIALDMTIRGSEDRSWRKSFHTFSVLGPWLVTADEIADPGQLDLSLHVNGELRQSSNTRSLIFDVAKLVEYASSAYALCPGDIIMTGTPEGVGPVAAGDVMTCFVQGVGTMQVPVRKAG